MSPRRSILTLSAVMVALACVALTGCDAADSAVSTGPRSGQPSASAPRSPWIAYQGLSDRGQDGIFLVHPDGSDDHEILLDVPGRRLHPDFSRDGTMLAFDQSDGGVDQVYVAAADGTSARLVAKCDPVTCIQMWEPSWSPDGTRLAIATTVNGSPWMMGIAILDVDTGAVTQVVRHPQDDGQDHFPRWSPDGSRLVFWRGDASGDGGDTAVFTVGADGTGLEQLTDTSLVAGDPDYSPDGAQILFATHPLLQYPHAGRSEIYTMAADGTGQALLSHVGVDGARAAQPRWTPDGTAILYVRTTQEGQPRSIYQIDADGTGDRPVLTEKPVYTHPELQPTP
jgi:TolB protein